jgi:hypothetical protein
MASPNPMAEFHELKIKERPGGATVFEAQFIMVHRLRKSVK